MSISLTCKLSLYADDSALLFSHRDPAIIADHLSTELSRCKRWLVDNRLSLHIGKTECLLFGSKRRLKGVGEFQVFCDGTPVVRMFSRGRGRGEYHPATTPYPPMQEPVPIHSATSFFPCLPIPVPRPPFVKFHLGFRLHLQEFMPVPRHFRDRVPLNNISQSFTRRWTDRPKDQKPPIDRTSGAMSLTILKLKI